MLKRTKPRWSVDLFGRIVTLEYACSPTDGAGATVEECGVTELSVSTVAKLCAMVLVGRSVAWCDSHRSFCGCVGYDVARCLVDTPVGAMKRYASVCTAFSKAELALVRKKRQAECESIEHADHPR